MMFTRTHFLSSLLIGLLLLAGTSLWAQTCVPDSQYTAYGMHPSDTLPDATSMQPMSDDIQFVIDKDTVLFGFTLPWDSLRLETTLGVPSGMTVTCMNPAQNCMNDANGVDDIRFCINFSRQMGQNPAYPGYDSLELVFQYWVTTPFSPPPIFDTMAVYYRVAPPLAVNEGGDRPVLEVYPVPASGLAHARFTLASGAHVRLTVVDLLGREVALVADKMLAAGDHEFAIPTADLQNGTYILRAASDRAGIHADRKLVVAHE